MKAFARLFNEVDRTTRTNEKVAALERYFRATDPADAVWALHFLLGRRGRRTVKTTHLRQWAAEEAGLPLWMVEECYDQVGDLAETLALLLPASKEKEPLRLGQLVNEFLLPLSSASETRQRSLLGQVWRRLSRTECFLWHKLITGGFRVGVSRKLIVRALAGVAGLTPAVMEHRLMRQWEPTAEDFRSLLAASDPEDDPAQPYPFFLASPIEQNPEPVADPAGWQVEWKWDGIRVQLIRRAGETLLWSRGEEIITEAYPEIVGESKVLPNGTVLDGEIVAWRGDSPLSFNLLQRRLGRKQVTKRTMREVPVVFMAYDLLECEGVDIRSLPLLERRERLERIVKDARQRLEEQPEQPGGQAELFGDLFDDELGRAEVLRLSDLLPAGDGDAMRRLREGARGQGAEGLMLKRLDSSYGVGRQRGAWWKWKVDPYHMDAVLVAAQTGHGRRATLYTDYTFAVWDGEELVPVAKAYSGLTDEEIDRVDAFVREHTTGRFGPVRNVDPALVFELAFEGVQESSRHKSGIALRFPRISRWREDKTVKEADSVADLRALLEESRRP